MRATEILEKSIIIASHPDDEVLWFSSILEKVNEIVICYLDIASYPKLTIGRRKSLSEYPLKNISFLAVEESEAFFGANFNSPVITSYGIEISRKGKSDKKYIENYHNIKENLRKHLAGCQNVFTHNPWGEYGHEEHIQIYRIIKELQKKMEFDLWFSNYCSNKSFPLIIKYISEFDSEYITLKTNKKISNNIRDLYKKNGCWTWYDDWKWFDEESFIKDKTCKESVNKYGRAFPLNLIKVEVQIESKGKASIFSRLTAKIFKTFIPEKDYSYFVGARTNFEMFAQVLNKDSVKIVHTGYRSLDV